MCPSADRAAVVVAPRYLHTTADTAPGGTNAVLVPAGRAGGPGLSAGHPLGGTALARAPAPAGEGADKDGPDEAGRSCESATPATTPEATTNAPAALQ